MANLRWLAMVLVAAIVPLASAQDQSGSAPPDAEKNPVTFHVQVVSRSTQAVDYRRGGGSTKIKLRGTSLMPEAKGDAKVDSKTGRVEIDADLEHVKPAYTFGLEYMTYVLWAITPQGRAQNLGELVVHDDKVSLHATTELQAFGLIVTAEPYFAVSQPGDLVVAENVIPNDVKGRVEPINVNYELLPHALYTAQVTPIKDQIYGVDTKTPLDLLQARNALRIARDAHADQYATSTYDKAEADLKQAEDYYRRKQGSKPIGTVAREAVQTAEEARIISLRKQQEDELARERREAAEREAQARADAEEKARLAREAEEQRVAAAQRAEQEAQQRQQAEQQRIAAEQARLQAEQAKQAADAASQQAQLQAQQAEQARQQAEQEKAQMRARLMQQLNTVLQTRDTARGLIATMPDVLFATGSATLRPAARERLARVAGILLSYPDLKLEIDGHTDSTGTPQFNEKLSQQRAEAVRSYLSQQGVADSSMTTQGFGQDQPIATNSTAAGRQQNRRVEIVVSGNVIGQQIGPNQPVENPPSQQ
jgi:outer membrane protein OmpA-like peptidoglycan-associated protein